METNNNKFTKIKYGDKEYYVVDFFEHKGRKYYFIVEKFYVDGMEDIKEYGNKNIEANFIYKVYDKYYDNVVDDKLYKELFDIVTKRIFVGGNKYFKHIYEEKKDA